MLLIKFDLYLFYQNETIILKIRIMKTTYSLIKRIYGEEINQINQKTYATPEDARNAGNSWLKDCRVDAKIREGRSFEVVENTEKGFNFTGITR